MTRIACGTMIWRIDFIGVMPSGFRHVLESGASPMEVWAPIALDNPDTNFLNVRNARVYDLIGRLEPGRTVEDARAELAVLAARLRQRGSPESKPVGAPHDETGSSG